MSYTVCLGAAALTYPSGGGHFWVYLNWALGFKALGCRVLWLEVVPACMDRTRVVECSSVLRERLERFGFANALVLVAERGEALPPELAAGWTTVEEAFEADLFLNQYYALPESLVRRFRRTALLDIDPGLLQIWMHGGDLRVARYDFYFTIGETVGQAGSGIPDLGLDWLYTPPCVDTATWQPIEADAAASFTTVTHWYSNEWVVVGDDRYRNDKRSAFLSFIDLPRRTRQPLEIATFFGHSDDERLLRAHGWRVSDSQVVAKSPEAFFRYVRASRGEFSCAKPSWVRLQNAWMSDRTLCYLSSGKPAVVQHTGKSRYLPSREGLFRFNTMDEAVACLETAAADYARHSRAARELVEELFDARKCAARVLERTLA